MGSDAGMSIRALGYGGVEQMRSAGGAWGLMAILRLTEYRTGERARYPDKLTRRQVLLP